MRKGLVIAVACLDGAMVLDTDKSGYWTQIGPKLDPNFKGFFADVRRCFYTLRKARSDKHAEQRSCLNIADERRRPCWIGWNA